MCLPRAQGINSTEKLRGAGTGQALLVSGQKISSFKVFYLNSWVFWKLLSQSGLCHPATLQRARCGVWLKRGQLLYRIISGQRSYCDNIFVQCTEQHRKQSLGTLIWLLSYPNKRLTLQYTNYSSVVLTLSLLPVCIYFLHAHSSLKITGSKIACSTESFGRAERDGKKSLSFGGKKTQMLKTKLELSKWLITATW